jgi:hypothetical protein
LVDEYRSFIPEIAVDIKGVKMAAKIISTASATNSSMSENPKLPFGVLRYFLIPDSIVSKSVCP